MDNLFSVIMSVKLDDVDKPPLVTFNEVLGTQQAIEILSRTVVSETGRPVIEVIREACDLVEDIEDQIIAVKISKGMVSASGVLTINKAEKPILH